MKDVCLTPRDLADDIPRSFKISNRWPKENGFGRNKVCREKSAEGGCAVKDVCLTPRDLADDIPRSFKISNRWPKENGFGRNKVCREKSAEGIVGH